MTVLILAAGQQQRWGNHPLKQLLPIGNTTILDRIVYQLDNRAIVVSHHKEILKRYTSIVPTGRRFTCETLLDTSPYWLSQVVVLLGDVIYSYNTISKILECRDGFKAFGNEWEIFALSFNECDNVKHYLKQTIKEAELGFCKGTLRDFFRNYTNTIEGNDTDHKCFEKVCNITDYTNDIDTPEEYEAFLRQHLQTMIHDDNNQE